MLAGHDAAGVFDYTPRRLVAFWLEMRRSQNRRNAEALQIAFMAARGKDSAVNEQLREWQKD